MGLLESGTNGRDKETGKKRNEISKGSSFKLLVEVLE